METEGTIGRDLEPKNGSQQRLRDDAMRKHRDGALATTSAGSEHA